VATYDYPDESGALLFVVGRFEYRNPDGSFVLKDGKHKKSFRQKRPDPAKPGGWINNVDGVRIVPYRLPELTEAIANDHFIAIVEGEAKAKADLLWSWSVPATCNAQGAGKWKPEHTEFLRGADVVILPDNDEPGRNHADVVAASLQGIARSVRVLELPELEPKQDVIDWAGQGGTVEQLHDLIAQQAKAPRANTEQQTADWDDEAEAAEATTPELEARDAGDDTEPPPPRRWLLGNQFCRRFLSGLVAPGSTGKSALRLLQCLSLATGRTLTGQHVFRRSRVLVVSLEDDAEEMRRKILAAMLHHGITRNQVKGWLFYACPKGIKLAEIKDGSRQIGLLEKQLRAWIERRRPDLVVLDPYVKLHALEENDNGAMDFVCDLLVTLAIEYDIAIDAPHHTKKGQLAPGDPDAGRGGSAVRDAGRLIYTLTTMSEEEAKTFGINAEDRAAYVRVDKGKVNLAPPARTAEWFKLVGVRLENGDDEYPNGDEVQTVEPCSPPKLWDGLASAILNTVLTEIDTGMPNGQRYTDKGGGTGPRAAWKVVQKHCNRTEGQCREIIRTWIRNGVLNHEEYDDPIERKPRSGLRLNTSKRPT
jgi:AAA domain